MNVSYGLPEGNHLIAKRKQRLLEPIGHARGERQRLRVAHRFAFDGVVVKPGVGLRDEHDARRIESRGLLKCILNPLDIRVAPSRPLHWVRKIFTKVVARSLNIHGREGDAMIRPATVLDAGNHLASRTKALWR